MTGTSLAVHIGALGRGDGHGYHMLWFGLTRYLKDFYLTFKGKTFIDNQ
jgi:hypothetical protein